MEFRLLGPFEARHDDGRPITIVRRRERSLLAVLLLDVGRTMSVDRLTMLLWDGVPPESARSTLHVSVSRLRQTLTGTTATIHTDDDGYRIDVARSSIDACRFVDGVAGAAAIDDPAERAAAFDTALTLWRGPVLAGVFDEFSRAEVGRSLEDARLDAIEQRADALLQAGHHARVAGDLASVAGDLASLVAMHPLRERAVGLLMTALYRCQRQSEALALFRDTRDRLAEELGIEPGPELTGVHRQILRYDPALAAPATAPRRIGGLDMLPREPVDFVGRTAMLDAISDLVDAGSPVVISGMSGVGKSALAVRWTRRHAEQFPDGRLFINLRGYDARAPLTPIAALTNLLGALGVPADRIPIAEAAAAALFRSVVADRAMVLVLDNARSADQVRPLLPAGPRNAVLITSRDTLAGLVARDGAQQMKLDVLTEAESTTLLTMLLSSRAADLPASRALLATLCGRLPLALRIAAAHLRTEEARSIDDLIAQLSSDTRVEVFDIPGDPDNALSALFDQSFHTLDGVAQRLLLILAAGPFTDYSEHAVAAMSDVDITATRLGLETLAAAHTVIPLDADRYGFHDLVREYARERATRTPSAVARDLAIDRLVDWYGHLALEIGNVVRPGHPAPIPGLRPSPDDMPFAPDLAAIDEFMDHELANLTTTMRYAYQHGRSDDAWRIIATLYPYLARGRYGVAALDLALLGLDAALKVGTVDGERQMRTMLGVLSTNLRRTAEGVAHHTRAVELARTMNDDEVMARALGNLALAYRLAHQPEEALRTNLESMEYATKPGHPWDTASRLNNIANCYVDLGDYEAARSNIEQGLAVATDAGLDAVTAICLTSLGWLYLTERRFAAAIPPLQTGLALARSAGQRQSELQLLDHLARSYVGLGNRAEAIQYLEVALDACRTTGNPSHEVEVLALLAESYLARGETAATRRTLAAADLLLFAAEAEDQARLASVRRALHQVT